MEFFEVAVQFFKDGGLFLYPLALIFVVGVAITVERFIFLGKEATSNRNVWDQVVPHISAGNFNKVASITSSSKASIATAINYAIARLPSARHRDDIEKAMDESLIEIIPRIEKRTHYLSSLANIGLLVGLLGTVLGLIGAFAAIATANPAEKANLLAASISLAMNNTASGLFVAVVLLTTHMFLEAKTTKLIDSLEIATIKFLSAVVERRGLESSVEPAPAAAGAPRGMVAARGAT